MDLDLYYALFGVSQTITFKAKWTSINHSLLHKLGILLFSGMCNVHTYELSIVLLYVEFDVIVKIGEKEVNQNNHKMNNYKSKNILSQSKGTLETLGKRNIHNTEKVICT